MNESKVAYRYKLFAIFVVKLSRLSYFTALLFTFKPLYPPKKIRRQHFTASAPGRREP